MFYSYHVSYSQLTHILIKVKAFKVKLFPLNLLKDAMALSFLLETRTFILIGRLKFAILLRNLRKV